MLQEERVKQKSIDKPLMIALQDLEYNSLKNLNLHVKAGEIYSIIGKADSGKHELLGCINRIYQPTYGKITIDNQNLNSLLEKELNDLRRKIALITKVPRLISSKNVFHNISLPMRLQKSFTREEIKNTTESLMHFVGIAEHASTLPDYLTSLQKQLVNIARALVLRPKALLCDDITYHLDVKATHQIVNLLSSINKEFGITMVIISNETEIIKTLSHKVGVMDKGAIIEESSAYEIFAKPKTEFAKELVKATTRQEMPWIYRRKIRFQATQSKHPIVRISFTTVVATEQLLAQIIEHYQFKVTIIQAYKEYIQHKAINIILAEIRGIEEYFEENFNEAMLFLQKNELHVEVLGYVANIT